MIVCVENTKNQQQQTPGTNKNYSNVAGCIKLNIHKSVDFLCTSKEQLNF
jgi:hypothetical protein